VETGRVLVDMTRPDLACAAVIPLRGPYRWWWCPVVDVGRRPSLRLCPVARVPFPVRWPMSVSG